jgi:hypothetical protein
MIGSTFSLALFIPADQEEACPRTTGLERARQAPLKSLRSSRAGRLRCSRGSILGSAGRLSLFLLARGNGTFGNTAGAMNTSRGKLVRLEIGVKETSESYLGEASIERKSSGLARFSSSVLVRLNNRPGRSRSRSNDLDRLPERSVQAA